MRTIFLYYLLMVNVYVILMMNYYLKNHCLSYYLKNHCLSYYLMKKSYLMIRIYRYLMMYWIFHCYFVDCFVCGFLLYL